MRFYFSERPLNKSFVILSEDNSFKTVNNEFWNFQVAIEPYDVLLLNFNYELKECVGLEGYLNLSKCKKREIILDCTKSGILKVDQFPVSKDAHGTIYKLDSKKCYFDDKSMIIAFGDIDSNVETFNFGKGQFVKIEDGKIISLYIKFE